jgi:hypothetical protein
MKFKYLDTLSKPVIIDNSYLRCFVHEPFKIDTGEIWTCDLGFDLELDWTRLKVTGERNDSIFVYHVQLPFVRLINFGKTRVFERKEWLVDLYLSMVFTLALDD